VQFIDGDLNAALAAARKAGQRVFVDFDASWCPTCRQLEREVLATAEGKALLDGLIAVHVDYDDEKNRAFIERYVILGLPTTAVLDVDGNQLVRVMGFTSKEAWMVPMRAALTAKDPLPELRAALAKAPDDDGVRLALGKALLVRNQVAEAEALLEPLLWRTVGLGKLDAHGEEARDHSKERAAEVLWALGRFHHRVKRDPATAQHLWRELATRFAKTSWAGGAWHWYAKAQAELGRPAAGAAALAALVRRTPTDAESVEAWLQFARKHKLDAEKPAVNAAIAKLPDSPAKTSLGAELKRWTAR
jgi:thiol-disulfide isomerase/thioredoxin